MASLSASIRNALIDHLTGTATYTPPTFYVALYTGDPAVAGVEVTTPGTNGYSRQSPGLGAASNGLASNVADVVFGPVDTANWGNVTHVATFDAASGGTLLWADPVTEWVMPIGATYTISTGKYRVRIS